MKLRVLTVLLAVAAAVAGAVFGGGGASAGPNIWTPVGPKALEALVTRDNVGGVYAVAAGSMEATYNGLAASAVYKSTDGGVSWRVVGDFAASSGLAYPTPFYMAASADGRVLMLNALVGNRLPLLKSSDGGATWREVEAYFETNNLVMDPTDSNRMYAAGKDGFHRSTDGGENWERMGTTTPVPQVAIFRGQIAVNPARPANLLAVTEDGVRVSDDYGANWRTVAPAPNPNLPPEERTVPDSVGGLMLTFVARPGGDSWVVAAEREGVYASKDGGRTWTKGSYEGKALRGIVLGLDAAGGRIHLAFRPYDNETYGQPPRQLPLTLFTSTDGENWTEVGPLPLRKTLPGGSYTGVIFASQATPERIFRGDGVVSNDGGRTWAGPSRGLPLTELAAQSFSTAGPHWFAGAGLSLYRSSDSGANWTQLAPQGEIEGGTPASYYESITGVGVQGDVILAHLFPHLVPGGPGGHYIRAATVARSTDAGATWQMTGLATNGREARFAFHGDTVYMAVSPIVRSLGTRYTTSGPGGLYKSVDGGATWTQLPVGMPVNNAIVERGDRSHVLAAGSEGLAESTDGGATWRRIGTSPQVGGLVSSGPESFARLYAYGAEGLDEREGIRRGGLYTSTDGGRTWAGLNIGGLSPEQYRVVTYGLGESGALVAAWRPREGGGVRVSQSWDGGVTWRELTGLGLPPNLEGVHFDAASGVALAWGQGLRSYYPVVVERPDPAFARLWMRQDEPVSARVAQRSWTWGQAPFSTQVEELQGLPGNSRMVQYWDKSRMEVNDPGQDRDAPWFVTNGLLTVEMVAGRVQTGVTRWEPRPPSLVPVAGDADRAANPNAPTYASFRGVASYESDNNRSANLVGRRVSQSIDARGHVGSDVPAGANVTLAAYDEQAGHNIAGPFWEFLNRSGPVASAPGQYVTAPIFGDWVFVMGRPISEPYWASVRVGGEDRAVLVQLFERRVLTYTPGNEPQWQVEMGNVGLHYYVWRYGR